ncbi:hypothetical protein ES705_15265 [subsurface metagenome]
MGFLQRGFAYGNRRGFAIPLPELLVEEQILHNTYGGLYLGGIEWAGQRFWLPPNRKIATLAFVLCKFGNPPGVITFTIREYPTNIPLLSKVWGNASDVPSTYPPVEWQEVEFDTPQLIDTLVEMIVEYSEGDGGNCIAIASQGGGSVKPDEEFYRAVEGVDPTSDAAYRYKYYE